jgi:hypothetical protein
VSKAEDLRAALAVAEAEEAFAEQKALWRAGELDREEWQAAKRAVTLARTKQRVLAGRPGSENFRLESDGTLVALSKTIKAIKVRDENGNIIPSQTMIVEEEIEEVLG